jgi:hypothetical protein
MISMITKLLKSSFRRNTVRAVRIDRCDINGDLMIPIYIYILYLKMQVIIIHMKDASLRTEGIRVSKSDYSHNTSRGPICRQYAAEPHAVLTI